MLSGHSKAIILYLYKQCKINRKCDVLVSSESIVTSTNIAIGSISTTLKRLKENGYIEILQVKSGAGAWRLIRLNDSIYKEILANELPHNCHTHSDTNPPVVVSSNITTTTNSYIQSVDNLPIDWQAINYEPVRGVGFSESTILQLYSAKRTTAKVVQESIDNFALNLQHNLTAYKNPLGALISVLSKGLSWNRNDATKPTAEPLNPVAEQEEAKQEAAAERERIEHIFHKEYCKWYDALSNDELKQLFPAYDLSKFRYGEVETEAEEVFRKTKWMEIYNNISH